MTPAFAELVAATNFGFLHGASHPEEMAAAAQALGLAGLAVADRNSLAGVVRGHLKAKEIGLRYAVGCRLVFRSLPPVGEATSDNILPFAAAHPPHGANPASGQAGNPGSNADETARLSRRSPASVILMPKSETAAGGSETGVAGGTSRRRPPRRGTPSPVGAIGHPPAAPDLVAWPTDRTAYGRLCRLLTAGNRRAEKGSCHLDLADLLDWGDGMILGVIPPARPDAVALGATLAMLTDTFPGSVRLIATRGYGPGDGRRLALLAGLAARHGAPLLASNDALYHAADRRPLQDVLTAIREHVPLATAGRRLAANAERHLKGAAEMARLFHDFPAAVTESLAVLERLEFSLGQLHYCYPDEPTGDAASPQEALEQLAEAGARMRYPDGVPREIRERIASELALIRERDYAPYFLTVHDIVRFAREKGILCQGRGSAANSVVCFCLGITEVNPIHHELLFERFLSPERDEPPDIDVDFEHERREEVMQYIYEKYSRERAGIAATVITYRARSAVREVGKAFGLSEDTIGALAGSIWGWSNEGIAAADARRAGLDPESATMRQVMQFARAITGFPRHLSQHVGGFVITQDRLDESVPVMKGGMPDRTHIEWDKDDLDAVGMMKVDVLALGMLSCIRRAFAFLHAHYGVAHTLASIHDEDPAVYRMLQRADSLGVFQVESRAQMTMLPRLKPAKFYDLVIEVAIVRPGPIQGDMVHPYLRRRQGIEEVFYPAPAPEHGPPDELKKVLGRTLGVPLFQEQAMKIAMVAAKFSGGEADKLRRAMATFRRVGTIQNFRDKMVEGMVRRGYVRDFAERCFRQIEGFGEYGFPESHAASFALLVYASAWIKCFYPDVFCAALLNAQPMGFYAPAQIVRDAREHGVLVQPVDVNFSGWDSSLEPEDDDAAGEAPTNPANGAPGRAGESVEMSNAGRRAAAAHATQRGDIRTTHAVRLGFRQIGGFREDDAKALIAGRGGGFDSVRDLWLRSGLTRAAVERLADADAFRSLGLDRRAALWAARALGAGGKSARLPLFDIADGDGPRPDADGRAVGGEPEVALPAMPLGEHVVNDYRFLSLSLKAHPVSFLRPLLAAEGARENHTLAEVPSGRRVTVAGLVLVRQRPGTASGVVFATIEDETGIANIIIWPKVFERFRPVVLGSRLVRVSGRLQSESGVIHVVADRLDDRSALLSRLSADAADLTTFARADQPSRGEETNPDGRNRPKPPRGPPSGKLLGDDADSGPPRLDQATKATARVMPKGRNFH